VILPNPSSEGQVCLGRDEDQMSSNSNSLKEAPPAPTIRIHSEGHTVLLTGSMVRSPNDFTRSPSRVQTQTQAQTQNNAMTEHRPKQVMPLAFPLETLQEMYQCMQDISQRQEHLANTMLSAEDFVSTLSSVTSAIESDRTSMKDFSNKLFKQVEFVQSRLEGETAKRTELDTRLSQDIERLAKRLHESSVLLQPDKAKKGRMGWDAVASDTNQGYYLDANTDRINKLERNLASLLDSGSPDRIAKLERNVASLSPDRKDVASLHDIGSSSTIIQMEMEGLKMEFYSEIENMFKLMREEKAARQASAEQNECALMSLRASVKDGSLLKLEVQDMISQDLHGLAVRVDEMSDTLREEKAAREASAEQNDCALLSLRASADALRDLRGLAVRVDEMSDTLNRGRMEWLGLAVRVDGMSGHVSQNADRCQMESKQAFDKSLEVSCIQEERPSLAAFLKKQRVLRE